MLIESMYPCRGESEAKTDPTSSAVDTVGYAPLVAEVEADEWCPSAPGTPLCAFSYVLTVLAGRLLELPAWDTQGRESGSSTTRTRVVTSSDLAIPWLGDWGNNSQPKRRQQIAVDCPLQLVPHS